MKKLTLLSKLLLIPLLLILASCQSGTSTENKQTDTEAQLSGETDKLEKLLGIPLYPNAKLANFFTFDRNDNDEIPDQLKEASMEFIIDDSEKVAPFYENKLGKEFTVEIQDGKKYYTLAYLKDGWEYEIFVGHDTYMNKPIYSLSVLKQE